MGDTKEPTFNLILCLYSGTGITFGLPRAPQTQAEILNAIFVTFVQIGSKLHTSFLNSLCTNKVQFRPRLQILETLGIFFFNLKLFLIQNDWF